MNSRLHKNARTTLAIRRELQAQPPSVSNRELAEIYGINRHTVAKWRRRENMEDASHRLHRLRATLSPAQEAVVVALRETLLLFLDDLLAVTHEFIDTEVSRSGLNRCLHRHGVSNLRALMPREEGAPRHKAFKEYQPGCVHLDVKYLPRMPDRNQPTYLFVAIDCATRWVYVEILEEKTAASAGGFLKRLIDQAPFRLSKVLTGNGKEFTDRSCPPPGRSAPTGERRSTGTHAFDRICANHRIEHRLIRSGISRTDGMIERFDGCIADVLATRRFDPVQTLTAKLK